MRKILFRGKRVDNGEWVYGFVYYDSFGRIGIVNYSYDFYFSSSHLVILETVGQFTGLTDRNGKEIFEGDIVKYTLNHDSSQKEIITDIGWYNHAWRLNNIWLLTEIRSIEVIGNIHDKTNDNETN